MNAHAPMMATSDEAWQSGGPATGTSTTEDEAADPGTDRREEESAPPSLEDSFEAARQLLRRQVLAVERLEKRMAEAVEQFAVEMAATVEQEATILAGQQLAPESPAADADTPPEMQEALAPVYTVERRGKGRLWADADTQRRLAEARAKQESSKEPQGALNQPAFPIGSFGQRFNLAVGPFARFNQMGKFIAALQESDEVRAVRIGKLEAGGNLELAVLYAGDRPFEYFVEHLPGFKARVTHTGPDIIQASLAPDGMGVRVG